MTPEQRLQRMRDESRWADEPFRLRPDARRPVAWRPFVVSLGVTAAVLGALVVVLPRPADEGGASSAARPTSGETVEVLRQPDAQQAPASESESESESTTSLDGLRVAPGSPADSDVPGAGAQYGVEIANPTDETVVLDPCPEYVQTLEQDGRVVQRASGRLDCGGARELAPGDAPTFLLRLEVPPGVTGSAVLRWRLVDGPGFTTETEITG